MSTSLLSNRRTRVQKVCTLWTHDENFSKEEVVFNEEKFPELPTSPGSLIQIMALKHAPSVRDFQPTPHQTQGDGDGQDGFPETHSRRSRRGPVRITVDENGSVIQGGRDVDPEKSYIFVARSMRSELKSKHPNLQVCLWASTEMNST